MSIRARRDLRLTLLLPYCKLYWLAFRKSALQYAWVYVVSGGTARASKQSAHPLPCNGHRHRLLWQVAWLSFRCRSTITTESSSETPKSVLTGPRAVHCHIFKKTDEWLYLSALKVQGSSEHWRSDWLEPHPSSYNMMYAHMKQFCSDQTGFQDPQNKVPVGSKRNPLIWSPQVTLTIVFIVSISQVWKSPTNENLTCWWSSVKFKIVLSQSNYGAWHDAFWVQRPVVTACPVVLEKFSSLPNYN